MHQQWQCRLNRKLIVNSCAYAYTVIEQVLGEYVRQNFGFQRTGTHQFQLVRQIHLGRNVDATEIYLAVCRIANVSEELSKSASSLEEITQNIDADMC